MPPAPEPPPAPTTFGRDNLERAGFVGWRTWAALRAGGFVEVPDGPPAYVVHRPSSAPPDFLATSPGGRFKGKDPTVPPDRLRGEWVPGARVVYIGKADRARRRLRDDARFGAGAPVGHWGGRLVWQLADAHCLLVAWRPADGNGGARAEKRRLLARFAELHGGRRPFANLTG